jgi:hypothetical protein
VIPVWPIYWIVLPIFGAFVGGSLGGFVAGAFEAVERYVNENLVRFIRADIPSDTNLYILRGVGDEASLSLGSAENLSWAATKAFAYFAKLAKKKSSVQANISAIFILSLLVLIINVAFWPVDQTIVAISKVVCKFASVPFLFGARTAIFGAVFLLLVFAMVAASLGFGVVPPNELEMGKFRRWGIAVLSVLIVEVYVEQAPPGSWKVNMLERQPKDEASNGGPLVHSSIYDDPRAHKALVQWLETSSPTVG